MKLQKRTKYILATVFLTLITCGIITGIVVQAQKKASESDSAKKSTAESGLDRIAAIGLDGKPKRWVFLVKLGNDKQHENCTHKGKQYLCKYLYADDENEELKLIQESILYKTWKFVTDQTNRFTMWNDQPGSGSYAHDKGWIVWNEEQGVSCHHSAPNWPDGSRDKMSIYKGMGGENPGTTTGLSQHFLLITLNRQEVERLLQFVKLAHVKYHYPKDLKEKPVETKPLFSSPQNLEMMKIDNLTIFPKPSYVHYDFWKFFADKFCKGKIVTWTFCVPPCGQNKGNHIVNYKEVVDFDGMGNGFGSFPWKANHMKLGRCVKKKIVGISGWNHSHSQIPRGSLFIAIDSEKLHESFETLFKT